MSIHHMGDFLKIPPAESIVEYGIWGGIPRYWELRVQAESFEAAIRKNILDPNGILYEEPERLFADEMRTSVQAFSILSLIGSGIHRLSEIAARLDKPATQLSRILGFLINQGYIRREIPFGEPVRPAKKSLYKLDDPFLNFYFTFLVPNKSRLEFDLVDRVWLDIQMNLGQYISGIWEDLCRKAIPFLEVNGKTFNPASRWWGTDKDRKQAEVDVVAESTDTSTLLIGEIKWSDKSNVIDLMAALNMKCFMLPFAQNKPVVKVLFLKEKISIADTDFHIFTPDDIVSLSR